MRERASVLREQRFKGYFLPNPCLTAIFILHSLPVLFVYTPGAFLNRFYGCWFNLCAEQSAFANCTPTSVLTACQSAIVSSGYIIVEIHRSQPYCSSSSARYFSSFPCWSPAPSCLREVSFLALFSPLCPQNSDHSHSIFVYSMADKAQIGLVGLAVMGQVRFCFFLVCR